jgi:hypothetical protein
MPCLQVCHADTFLMISEKNQAKAQKTRRSPRSSRRRPRSASHVRAGAVGVEEADTRVLQG